MVVQGLVKNEQQLIRVLIDKPDFIDQVDPKFFVTDIGRNFYLTLQELFEKSISPLKTHIVSFGNKRDDSIIHERVESLFDIEYDVNSFPHYYERLKTDFAKHIIQKKYLPDIIEQSSEKGEMDTERMRTLMENIGESLDLIEDKKELLITSGSMIDKYTEVLKLRNQGEYFFSCGDSFLDQNLIVGFAPKWITTIFGATGIGKSIFGLHLVNRQINRHIPCLYISLEMDMISTMDRLIALRNKIPITDLYPNAYRNESISSHIMEKINRERLNLGKAKYFLFVEEPGLSLADIIMLIKEAKKRMGVDYLIVTIDLLTMIRDFNEGRGSKAEVYENCMNRLHEIAKNLNVHFVGIVQANRDADNSKIKEIEDIKKLKPSLNNIKNSGAIGERSRIVLSTFRAKYYAERYLPELPETKIMQDIMEVDILKQNMGRLAHMKYLHDGDIAKLCRLKTTKQVLSDEV